MSKQIYTAQGDPVDPSKIRKDTNGLVTVYNVKTGDKDACFPIDARERVGTGGWSYDPPKPKKQPEEKPKSKPKASRTAVKKAAK